MKFEIDITCYLGVALKLVCKCDLICLIDIILLVFYIFRGMEIFWWLFFTFYFCLPFIKDFTRKVESRSLRHGKKFRVSFLCLPMFLVTIWKLEKCTWLIVVFFFFEKKAYWTTIPKVRSTWVIHSKSKTIKWQNLTHHKQKTKKEQHCTVTCYLAIPTFLRNVKKVRLTKPKQSKLLLISIS